MPSVLVVGASRGIGLELARQYLADGWRVHASTRTPRAPGALGRLDAPSGSGGELIIHELEVRDRSQLARLVDALADEGLDVLVHNAGVYGTGMRREDVMAINADAPIAVAEALLPALERGDQRKILLMTSQVGARHGARRSLGLYGDSKATLNDRFRELAPAWRARGMTAVVMHPGWVRTDMGGRGAPLGVEESVRGIRRVLAGLEAGHHGRFLQWDGRDHPW